MTRENDALQDGLLRRNGEFSDADDEARPVVTQAGDFKALGAILRAPRGDRRGAQGRGAPMGIRALSPETRDDPRLTLAAVFQRAQGFALATKSNLSTAIV
jgi:hypothetical protein